MNLTGDETIEEPLGIMVYGDNPQDFDINCKRKNILVGWLMNEFYPEALEDMTETRSLFQSNPDQFTIDGWHPDREKTLLEQIQSSLADSHAKGLKPIKILIPMTQSQKLFEEMSPTLRYSPGAFTTFENATLYGVSVELDKDIDKIRIVMED